MMDYAEYVSAIKFRFIQPHMRVPLPRSYYDARLTLIMEKGVTGFSERLGVGIEYVNTVLPEDVDEMKTRLREVCAIPKMSTLAIGALINRGVASIGPEEAFVNVGVWHGFTLLAGMVGNGDRNCVGVDNFSEFGGPRDRFLARFNHYKSPRHTFYEMDYLDYFSSIHRGPIGFYMYDGSHDYDNQLQGLLVAEPFFSPSCVVLVDDTNWEDPRRATQDFLACSSNRYHMLLDATTEYNCHPSFWNGVMIFQRDGTG